MNKITFGLSQIKERTPSVIKWVRNASALLLAIISLAYKFYPNIIPNALVIEMATFSAFITSLAPLFGVKTEESNTNTQTQ